MRVLFLTHRLPYAPNRGDRIRAYHIVKSLSARMEVEVVSLVHDDHEMAQAERLREIGVRVTAIRVPRIRNLANAALRLLGPQPLTHLLGSFICKCQCQNVGRYHLVMLDQVGNS